MGASDLSTLRTESLRDPALWHSIAPALHVADTAFLQTQPTFEIPAEVAADLNARLREEGYFQLPPVPWNLPIEQMAALVAQLDARGIPLPFSFVYDEFWLLFWRLDKMITSILGPGYLRLPDFWTWLVDPARRHSGWQPHRDKGYQSLYPDRSPKSLTLWLPLTEATPLNGCMYLVPADRDPTYATPQDKEWKHKHSDVRALPAAAGSVLCWTQAVLHWGSNTSPRGAAPRISVAFEFQSGQVPPMNEPVTSPSIMPNLPLRLAMIAKQILQYQHMYPLEEPVAQLAKQVLDQYAAANQAAA
jgi:hypothetical protein